MSKLHVLTLISVLLLVVAIGCSSSDQAAIDKAVSATLAGAQPATAVAPATSTPARVTEPTAAPVPTPEPVDTPSPVPVPTLTAVMKAFTGTPTPFPTYIFQTATPTVVPTPTVSPTENETVIVTAKTKLIGIESSQIVLEDVQVKVLSDVGVLEAWARWDSNEEWEQISINQETGSVSGSHVYSKAGEYTSSVWVQG